MKIIFWQNIISPHQTDFISELSSRSGVRVILVVQDATESNRTEMGWTIPKLSSYEICVAPNLETIKKIVTQENNNSVHIFSGIRAYPMVSEAFKIARRNNCIIGIMAESADWIGWKGKLRLVRDQIDALMLRSKINFILAIGELAKIWFKKVGYRPDLIYDWGYFVHIDRKDKPNSNIVHSGKNKIVFCGRLTKEKGLDSLLMALNKLKVPFCLNIIGDGSEKDNLDKQSKYLKINESIIWNGFMPREDAIKKIGTSDLLVLPSSGKDGWGTVVNEALIQGVPCVVSENCGSSSLINNDILGSTFPANDFAALKECIENEFKKNILIPDRRNEIIRMSEKFSPKSAVDYFLSILDNQCRSLVYKRKFKINAPWMNKY